MRAATAGAGTPSRSRDPVTTPPEIPQQTPHQALPETPTTVPAQGGAPDEGWLCTGAHWAGERAVLVTVSGGQEHIRPLEAGRRVALAWHGPRRCVGWSAPGTGRTPCPDGRPVGAATTLAQCESCQARDHGLAVARDRIVDDGRTYQLYLAWFAPGMLKVGITAEARGVARLLEQAAIGYTVIATGSLPAIRRAELTLSGTGLARERFRARAKVEAWWHLPQSDVLHDALAEARCRALGILAEHQLAVLPDGPIVDRTAFFGFAAGSPAAYQEVEALDDAGLLAGVLRQAVGKHLFVDVAGFRGPVLLDLRLLAGRRIAADGAAAGESGSFGLHVVERRKPITYDAPTLF